MLRFIAYKILNKKWLNASLLSGVILLTAFLCIYPMFREGSLNKLIQTLMGDHIEAYGEYPATINQTGKLQDAAYSDMATLQAYVDDVENSLKTNIGVTTVDCQRIYTLVAGYVEPSFSDNARQIKVGHIPQLEEKANLLYGTWPKDVNANTDENVKKAIAEGAIPLVMSEKMMNKYEFVVGETISYSVQYRGRQKEINLVICGVVSENKDDSFFWFKDFSEYDTLLMVDEEGFSKLIEIYCEKGIFFDESIMLDYRELTCKNIEEVARRAIRMRSASSDISNNFETTVRKYLENKKSITVILFTFEIPIVALLLLFLYMISGQILEMETTEIAMLKSRGISRIKIIGLYILQSSVISFIGLLPGIPLGYLFCKIGASTDAFLVFSLKNVSIYKFTFEMLLYAFIAFGLSVLFMTIPVIPLSKFTITESKTRKIKVKDKAFWEKYYLDIPILVLSGYLLFNYNRQISSISDQLVNGGSIDPIIFLNSSVFILGCGLFALRLIHLIVRLIYALGRKKWKPAEYVSFLQIIRNAKKQGFISVFLVMTIAMGVFNANLARSVNENMEQRVRYNTGSDMTISEKWKVTVVKAGSSMRWNYREPDYNRFEALKDAGVESFTRVIKDTNVNVILQTKTTNDCTLLGINSKEFGETAELKSNLNDRHWYEYLNLLAENPGGILISSNLAEKYELKVGDSINYARNDPTDRTNYNMLTKAEIVGIVDAFPGYETVTYTTDAAGKVVSKPNYLVVASYSDVVKNFRLRPYEVWMRFADGTDSEDVIEALNAQGVNIQSSVCADDLVEEERDSAMLQITNGMFSVGFIISIIVCGVGFLIYWVLTIKDRELIYGIYRAMGLSMGEIVRMLIVEQVFSSLFAAVGGFGVGILTTYLFTKLISIVYLPKKHNLPIEVFFRADDSIKMIVAISAVLIVCFIVIYRIIKKMNITKALKLGED